MNIVEIKGAKTAPKSERSSMETLLLTVDQVKQWQLPTSQRNLSVNGKVLELSKDMKANGVSIPGVLTLGRIGRSGTLYIVDGQHRIEAFILSGLPEIIADVRIITFDTMGELSKEYVQLNQHLKAFSPDDMLRGMEPYTAVLQRIRGECAYVGYDNIRRGTASPIVGMSMLLKVWFGSSRDTPAYPSGMTGAMIAETMTDDSAKELLRFLHIAYAAWGREYENHRLWGGLNMGITMWLYRRLVLDKTRGVKRFIVLNDAQFRQCLMSLAASGRYVDWLQGRNLRERDRSPAYAHIRQIFAKRLVDEGVAKPQFPAPAWYSQR